MLYQFIILLCLSFFLQKNDIFIGNVEDFFHDSEKRSSDLLFESGFDNHCHSPQRQTSFEQCGATGL